MHVGWNSLLKEKALQKHPNHKQSQMQFNSNLHLQTPGGGILHIMITAICYAFSLQLIPIHLNMESDQNAKSIQKAVGHQS